MNELHSAVFALVVVALTLGVGLMGAHAAYQDIPTETGTVENESILVDYANATSVDVDAYKYYDNETVVFNGTQLVEGTDYDFDTADGAVTWYDKAKTTDGGEASISYAYADKPVDAERIRGWTGTAYELGSFALVPLAGIAVVTLLTRWL
ncbi:hypothetical protein [Halomarina pelagica]|uniref:hypothetical protein n=1 Tax=Halomarina pelagica TaxID=2961599 RepID=UPI0020C2C811|nr:hypothetical protein [Halomarina sp. BND7]